MKQFISTLVIVTAVLLAATNAHGQGLLPKIITEARLAEYLKHLTLSDAQLHAISQFHDDYRAQWNEDFGAEISVYNAAWNAT